MQYLIPMMHYLLEVEGGRLVLSAFFVESMGISKKFVTSIRNGRRRNKIVKVKRKQFKLPIFLMLEDEMVVILRIVM